MGSLPKGDQAPEGVKFVITGFSKFCGIKDNPTEELVTILPEVMEARGLDISNIYSCSVIKVSALNCDRFLRSTAQKIALEFPDVTVAWIHFGLDSCAQSIALEKQAVNNATFSAPDEDGCIFMHKQIDESLPYNEIQKTPLNIDPIIRELQRQGFDIHASFHAGCFICNWMYYRSLRQTHTLNKPNWFPLFVHMPPFSEISRETQLDCLVSLVQLIKKQLSSQKQGLYIKN